MHFRLLFMHYCVLDYTNKKGLKSLINSDIIKFQDKPNLKPTGGKCKVLIMTKKEIRAFISQLWYECNNYNWYIYKVDSVMKEGLTDAVNTYKERRERRKSAVDSLVELGKVLGFDISFEGYEGAHNILNVWYNNELYMLWCLEYREEIQDTAYKCFRNRVNICKPTYYSSNFTKFEDEF